jgi:hypothetical protein
MKFGLAPEHLEAAAQADFATSVARSNLLLSKRIMMWQRLLTPLVSRFVQVYTLNHGGLMDELKEHIRTNFKGKKTKKTEEDVDLSEQLVQEVIQSIYVSLPNPDTSKLENQLESFTKYNEALEEALRAYFNIEMYEGMYDSDLEDAVEPMISAVRSYYQRQWLRQNNMLSELDSLVGVGGDNKPLLNIGDIHKVHTKAFMDSVEGVLREFRKKGRKGQRNLDKDEEKDLEKFDREDEEPEVSETTPEESTDPTTDEVGDSDVVEDTEVPEPEEELDEDSENSPDSDSGDDDLDLPEL